MNRSKLTLIGKASGLIPFSEDRQAQPKTYDNDLLQLLFHSGDGGPGWSKMLVSVLPKTLAQMLPLYN